MADLADLSLRSGSFLPPIDATLLDLFGNPLSITPLQPFVVSFDPSPPLKKPKTKGSNFIQAFLTIRSKEGSKVANLLGVTQQNFENPQAEISGIRVVGPPGQYILQLAPSASDPIYSQSQFTLRANLEIFECNADQGYFEYPDGTCELLRCEGIFPLLFLLLPLLSIAIRKFVELVPKISTPIKLLGCRVEIGAQCVSPGNCSCPPGYEGLQCELKTGFSSPILNPFRELKYSFIHNK